MAYGCPLLYLSFPSQQEKASVNFTGTYMGLRGHYTRGERLRKKMCLLGYIECPYFFKTKIGKNSVLVFFSRIYFVFLSD